MGSPGKFNEFCQDLGAEPSMTRCQLSCALQGGTPYPWVDNACCIEKSLIDIIINPPSWSIELPPWQSTWNIDLPTWEIPKWSGSWTGAELEFLKDNPQVLEFMKNHVEEIQSVMQVLLQYAKENPELLTAIANHMEDHELWIQYLEQNSEAFTRVAKQVLGMERETADLWLRQIVRFCEDNPEAVELLKNLLQDHALWVQYLDQHPDFLKMLIRELDRIISEADANTLRPCRPAVGGNVTSLLMGSGLPLLGSAFLYGSPILLAFWGVWWRSRSRRRRQGRSRQ